MEEWREIPQEKAKRQQLYGIQGWLLVLAGYLGLVFVTTVLYKFLLFPDIYPATGPTGAILSADGQAIRLTLFIDLTTTGVVLFTLFTKYNQFRLIASWLFLLKILLSMLNAFYISLSQENLLIFLYNGQQIIILTAWLLYLNQSERVRVTYESKISRHSFYDSQ